MLWVKVKLAILHLCSAPCPKQHLSEKILTLSSFCTRKWEGETFYPLEAGDLCAGQRVNTTEQNRAFTSPELSPWVFDFFFLQVTDSRIKGLQDVFSIKQTKIHQKAPHQLYNPSTKRKMPENTIKCNVKVLKFRRSPIFVICYCKMVCFFRKMGLPNVVAASLVLLSTIGRT